MSKKIEKIIIGLSFLILGTLVACDNYERTGVESTIYVNQQSLTLFIGDESQLIANPQQGDYTWQSEDANVATVANGLVKAIGEGSTSVIVTQGDMRTKVPVIVVVKVPLTDIQFSSQQIELFLGAGVTMNPTLVPANANDVAITDFAWWSEDKLVAEVNNSGDIVGVAEGVTNIVYRRGSITKKIAIDVAVSRPFKGPHILSADQPLILPMRDFDTGGDGNAFHESDDTNSFGNDDYRRNGGDDNSFSVDVENGNNVGWTNDGEWLLYTVEVHSAGTYAMQMSASGGGDGIFHVEVDGADKSGQTAIPSSGSWNNWQWHPSTPIELTLTEGKHKIKLFIDKAGFNCNELKFEFKQ